MISRPNLTRLSSSVHEGVRFITYLATCISFNSCKNYLLIRDPLHFFFLFQKLYPDVYMLDKNMKWHTLPPMPKANSHIECSWVLLNNSIIILGGTTENHPINKRMMLVGEVFRFDLDKQVSQFFPRKIISFRNHRIPNIYIYDSCLRFLPCTGMVCYREASLSY